MKSGSWKEVRASLDEVIRHKPPISERRVESITRLAIKNAKVIIIDDYFSFIYLINLFLFIQNI